MRDRREDVAPRAPDPRRLPGAPSATRWPGVREDTGERVLVGDSVACGALPRRARPGGRRSAATPRWMLGGFAERIAAPRGRAARGPGRARARRPPRWPSRSPPPCTRSTARRRARSRPTPACSAAARWARCSPRCSSPRAARSRSPTATRSGARRPRRSGALSAERLADHDVVFEAVGRPEAWRAAVQACAPGGCVVLVGGCAGGTDAAAADPPAALRRARRPRRVPPRARRGRPRARAARRRRRRLARAGRRPDRPRRPPGARSRAGNGGPARKWVVVPDANLQRYRRARGAQPRRCVGPTRRQVAR